MTDIKLFPADDLIVSPSILAANFGKLNEEITNAAAAGAQMLHLDVMDGHLVPNISFGAPVIKALRPLSDLFFDAHLMIERPLKYAAMFQKAGVNHITFHIEAQDDPAATLAAIHALGCSAGLSLCPGTPAEAIFPYLDEVDMVLVMTVEPGFGGQSFMADQLPKIAKFRKEIDLRGLHTRLEVDGGVDARTAPQVIAAGADTLVAGTAFFRNPSGMKTAFQQLTGRP